MADILDSLASYVQNMLMEMAKEEEHMLLGVTGEIENMGVKLGDLKNFLADADRRNITDLSVQSWVNELRHGMYEATDILDLCRLKAMEKGPSQNMGCFNPLLFYMRNPLHAHDIGRHIKNLNVRLDGIRARSASFNFINLGSYEDCGKNMVSLGSGARETSWGLDESGLVGEKIENDTRNLVQMLTQDYPIPKIMVFTILGVGGIGKTTLAQKIYNNEITKQKFSKRLWLSVNQDINQTEVLRRAIIEAGADHLPAENTKATLERALTKALNGHKTLLIMDDVWDHLAHGSRVLVTTRHDTVARGMFAEKPYHRIKNLCLEILGCFSRSSCLQVVGNGNNDELKVNALTEIGMGIIAKCDGLPLAVKRKALRNDWENVLNDSIWSVSQMPEDLKNVIYLSYNDLSPNLKPCFLHYALLPKSIVFKVGTIVARWISEGFVHGSSCEILGQEYYNQLIARNLIEPDQLYVDHKVCKMHDVVRSFAQYVSRDETLIALESETTHIGKHNSQHSHASLRTLYLFGQIKINPGDSLSSFSCVRAIHIEDGNFDALSDSLVKLKHLRYLSIGRTDTSKLPENIGKLKFLQHINLAGCERLMNLPGGIINLQQLRSLDLRGTGIINIPRGFCGLTNLRKLYGFPVHIDGDCCSLEELGPLNWLMRLQICGLENVSSSFAIKAKLGEKVRLTFYT
ncbi:hypothetical protein U9M48_005047 [Paspalum notatum var. saurae]|uniref:Uncharacterized protein n=1 Tax=Paspalum notatum var. saurae TaxID=547442 RepID=A0AAQ3SL88_PASNO